MHREGVFAIKWNGMYQASMDIENHQCGSVYTVLTKGYWGLRIVGVNRDPFEAAGMIDHHVSEST